TISFMVYAISMLINNLTPNNDIMETVDFTTNTMAFDEDICDEEINTLTIESSQIQIDIQDCNGLIYRVKNALYESLLHYNSIPSDIEMLASLLNSRCKSLGFVSNAEKKKTIDILKNIVTSLQSHLDEFQVVRSDNSLIARMLQSHHPKIDE
ncbi:708_t:CDS:1, partial [Acaulospora morrowiae]